MNAKEIFTRTIGAKNKLTPHIIDYAKINGGACELSYGEGMNNTVYGVTSVVDDRYDEEKSNLFDSLADAKKYIKTLK